MRNVLFFAGTRQDPWKGSNGETLKQPGFDLKHTICIHLQNFAGVPCEVSSGELVMCSSVNLSRKISLRGQNSPTIFSGS